MDYTPVKTDRQIARTAELARQIWTEHFTPIIGPDQVAYMLRTIQSETAIAEQIKNKGYIYYLISEGTRTIGYCAIVPEENVLFLSKLYIHKTMRRKGIARETIDFIKTIAHEKNLDRITLTVNKNNAGPIAAYEKLGFINTGPIVQDIGSGFIMDDYKMELALNIDKVSV